jgi:hypothetical protein
MTPFVHRFAWLVVDSPLFCEYHTLAAITPGAGSGPQGVPTGGPARLASKARPSRGTPAILLLAAALAVGGLLSGCVTGRSTDDGPPPTPPNIIRFVLRRDLPLAKAFLNGRDAGFFLLDTGSSLTVVDRAVAGRFKLAEGPKVQVTGIGGRVDSPLVKLDSLIVGGRNFGARSAAVIDMSDFNHTIGWPVAGILGLDSLQEFIFTMDLQGGALTFEDRAAFVPPPGAAAQRVAIVGNLPAVEGRMESNLPAVLQIDTGSNGSLAVSVRHVEQQTQLLAGKYNVHGEAYGVGGLAGTVTSELRNLTVFGQELHAVAFQVELSNPQTSGPVPRDAPILGRMGNQVLKKFRITFDLPHQRLWAVPY